MTWLENVSSIVGLVGGSAGVVTLGLGLRDRRTNQKLIQRQLELGQQQLKEIESSRRARKEDDQKEKEEDALYAELVRRTGSNGHNVGWQATPGTNKYAAMERLAAKGRVFRNNFGGYSLTPPPPNQWDSINSAYTLMQLSKRLDDPF